MKCLKGWWRRAHRKSRVRFLRTQSRAKLRYRIYNKLIFNKRGFDFTWLLLSLHTTWGKVPLPRVYPMYMNLHQKSAISTFCYLTSKFCCLMRICLFNFENKNVITLIILLNFIFIYFKFAVYFTPLINFEVNICRCSPLRLVKNG